MDFKRKWYHTRAKVSVEPIEDIDEQSQWVDDVEDIVFSNMRFKAFWNSLSEDDRIILTHSMNGLTQKEIADKMGFADHSAVSKKLQRMKNIFLSMDNDWRLFRDQERYLHGVTLVNQSYKPNKPSNDHDHCEFCMKKLEKVLTI